MKVFLLFLLISLKLIAQDNTKIHYGDLVEAYHNKESNNTLYIYDSLDGNIVDTLDVTDTKNSYYKIAILKSEYGWFKIKNIQRLPVDRKNFDFENHWVKSKDFLIYVDNYNNNHHVYLYDLPSQKANRIHKLNNFQVTSITETSDLWAKVSLKVGEKTVDGWLNFRDQCAYPWTTCLKCE